MVGPRLRQRMGGMVKYIKCDGTPGILSIAWRFQIISKRENFAGDRPALKSQTWLKAAGFLRTSNSSLVCDRPLESSIEFVLDPSNMSRVKIPAITLIGIQDANKPKRDVSS